MAEIAWKKWWNILWGNQNYALATFLNPAYRTKWFDEAKARTKGETTRIQDGLNRTGKVWQVWHSQQLEKDSEGLTNERESQLNRRRTLTKVQKTIYDLNKEVFGDWYIAAYSEYEEYSTLPVLVPQKDFSPLSWWCEVGQQAKWPHLSALAIHVLSFPAMSAEAERVFSGARRTISWTRSSLSPQKIETLECLKHYLSTEI